MGEIPDRSIALIVTSPPYFVGKEYEQALGDGHVPATYLDYLEMLYRVFKECKRVLEPGGRIAVNVANLGRKPYRSLSSDIIHILQDDLKFLLRGEVIWVKGKGASGSCAWGSFRKATNPVLRDITERVIIASKGRFDRAKSITQRMRERLPHKSTIYSDEFMEATLDRWEILAELASRVGHPAPFPVELPQRLIELYTFEGDVVLDPFMGSGSTLVAAARTRRRYIGYDIDQKYVEIARERVEAEEKRLKAEEAAYEYEWRPEVVKEGSDSLIQLTPSLSAPDNDNFQARASHEGKRAQVFAQNVIESCGFKIREANKKLSQLGVVVNFIAEDQRKHEWYFDVSGAFTTSRPGLQRTDTLWKALGKALVLKTHFKTHDSPRIILLTTDLPRPRSTGDVALHSVGSSAIFDVIEMRSARDQERLAKYATGEYTEKPITGFWTDDELSAEDFDEGE